jgi:hypothetical protein
MFPLSHSRRKQKNCTGQRTMRTAGELVTKSDAQAAGVLVAEAWEQRAKAEVGML